MKKSEQTYKWALETMSTPGLRPRLSSIAKCHWTDELLVEALRNGHAYLREIPERLCTSDVLLQAVRNGYVKLSEIPEQLVTDDLCVAAVCCDEKAIADIPEAMKSGELFRKLADAVPFAFLSIWREQREMDGLPRGVFSKDDVALCLAAFCPREWSKNAYWLKDSMSEKEKEMATVTHFGADIIRYFPADVTSSLFYLGLKSLLDNMSGDDETISVNS